MRKNRFTGKCSIITGFLLVNTGLFSSAAVADAAMLADQEMPSLETVIVIGEKTERSLKDTTSSVSVITEEALSSMQYLSVTDIVSDISNVVVLSGSVPDIRGVSGNGSASGFNSFTGGSKARVTTLVDGVAEPFIADLTGDTGLWDIEQIEVFRGPQSTSNGRNSIAGSMYIKTKDPVFEQEGAVRVGYRNEDRYLDTSVMLSGPLIDNQLAYRITAQHLDGDTNSDLKEFPANPTSFDLNALETERYRGKLLWTPTEQLSALLSFSKNREQGFSGRRYYADNDPWQFKPTFYRDMDTNAETTSLKLNYALNDVVSLEVLAAYMDYQWGYDGYEATPAAEQQLVMDENNRTLDAKLNFGNTDERVHGFVGLAYFDREQDFVSEGSTVYFGDDRSESNAIYSEVTYALTDVLNVIAGLRVERETQDRYFNLSNGRIEAELDRSKTITLPKLVFQYVLNDETTLSFGVRKGYNPAGGALAFVEGDYYYFDEESVTTYEASVRSAFAEGSIYLNANFFYNEYSDYQAFSSARVITNLDEVVTYGAEFELVASVTPQWQLRAGLGLLNSDIRNAGENYAEVEGNELNSAPQVTANVSSEYWFTDAFSASVSANYVDEYYGDFNNTRERVAGDYTLVKVSAGYEVEDWVIKAFVNNVFDAKERTLREPPSARNPDGFAAIVDPRHVGVSATYQF